MTTGKKLQETLISPDARCNISGNVHHVMSDKNRSELLIHRKFDRNQYISFVNTPIHWSGKVDFIFQDSSIISSEQSLANVVDNHLLD